MLASIEINNGKFFGDNDSGPCRSMDEIARTFNQQPILLNGAVTCVRRRQSTKLNHKRILG